MEVDLLIATTSKKWANNDDYVVFLESNNGYKSDSWTLDNHVRVEDKRLYIFNLFLLFLFFLFLFLFLLLLWELGLGFSMMLQVTVT